MLASLVSSATPKAPLADVAGDTIDFGVVKTVYDDLVIGPQQPKLCVDGAGSAALRASDDPHAEQDHDQHNDGS